MPQSRSRDNFPYPSSDWDTFRAAVRIRLGRFLFACKADLYKQQIQSLVKDLQGHDNSISFGIRIRVAKNTDRVDQTPAAGTAG
jgi:hypothetical protein